ncbi:MAG TPA: phosphoribosylanthranilate isomerase [Cytophagales bacterium]|nr:phosphoribosylanthranilate isomerase [Cytophagales bacterium]
MALSTFVKISSINNLSDARYCAGMGVDLIGFCMDKRHPNYVSPLQYKEITGWVTGVKTVAEIEDCPIEEVLELLKEYKFNYLEVKNIEILQKLSSLEKPFIYKLNINEMVSPPVHDHIHYYLVEGNNETFSKEEIRNIKEFSSKHSLIVSCGENKSIIKTLLNNTKIKGIELKGGDEISPGLKDFDGLSEILEMLEID